MKKYANIQVDTSNKKTASLTHLTQRRTAQMTILRSLDVLQEIPDEELEHIVDMCDFRTFLEGETIISERKASEFFFLVLQGNVSLKLHNKDGREVVLEILHRGHCCGEGPLFSGFSPRTGAYAVTRCYMLQLPLIGMRSLRSRIPVLSNTLHQLYLRRLVESKLAFVPVFNQISPQDRLHLAAQLQPASFQRGVTITTQGKSGGNLYIIDSGQVVIYQDEDIISALDEGDFFGEIALIFNQPHSATVRALTPCNILILPSNSIHDLLNQYPSLEDKILQIVKQRQSTVQALLNDTERRQRMKLAVRYGLIRGPQIFVRKTSLCSPNCTICEDACALRHVYKRLKLNGILICGYDIPNACRQCHVGPECVEVCPEHAIEWNDRHALVITDACTGCGACISACPYHLVWQVPRKPPLTHEPLTLIRSIFQTVKRFVVPEKDAVIDDYTYIANKCDLCHGYEDMACVNNCPQGALQLVAAEDILDLQNEAERNL